MTIKVAFYYVQQSSIPNLRRFFYQYDLPLSFAYLKSYIDKYLPQVAEFKIINDIKELNSGHFDVLAMTAYTEGFNQVEEAVRKAKKIHPEIFTIIGSYHITALPHTLPPSVDCGVIGEGEETFKEILEALNNEHSGPLTTDKLKKIDGIVFRQEGNLVKTNPRKLIEPLDIIPFPDRNIMNNTTLDMVIKRYILTSRGCPYSCNFCATGTLWGNHNLRQFSPDYVVSEIEYMLNNISPDINSLAFIDGLFIANKARLHEIVKCIEKKGINKKVEFVATVRANIINDETCALLKRMNMASVFIGLESDSSKMLNNFNKKITPQDNQLTLDLLYKYGIGSRCNFIFGTPEETPEDIYRTFDFILNNKQKIELIGISVLTPFPGTYYWNYAKEKELVSEDMDFVKLSEMGAMHIPGACSFEEWRKFREGYSVYLNNDIIEESKFYDLLQQFCKEIVAH